METKKNLIVHNGFEFCARLFAKSQRAKEGRIIQASEIGNGLFKGARLISLSDKELQNIYKENTDKTAFKCVAIINHTSREIMLKTSSIVDIPTRENLKILAKAIRYKL